jgi:hypothetical protein
MSTFNITKPSIPVDVLREILGHVRKADLPSLCRVNKIFCSCSQDFLYRDIIFADEDVIQTLAQSTDLARQVRSFYLNNECIELATALQNMSSLRSLDLERISDVSLLDGCTFKLESFSCDYPNSESLQKFLNSQPTLTDVTFQGGYKPLPPFDERCLPNLTCVRARPSWLGILIPGRPVREVEVLTDLSSDLSLSLSTTSIQKLWIDFDMLSPKPELFLVSIFPSLVHLVLDARYVIPVRVPLCLSI